MDFKINRSPKRMDVGKNSAYSGYVDYVYQKFD